MTTLREFHVAIPTGDGTAIAARIPIMVPMEFDEALGEWLIDSEGQKLIDDTRAFYMKGQP